jgi:enoyl-CoA hydratase/carnithine racemase
MSIPAAQSAPLPSGTEAPRAPQLTALTLTIADGIAEVELARPEKSNAMNRAMWAELRATFRYLDMLPAARVVMLTGAGTNFTAGIDLDMLMNVGALEKSDRCPGRVRENLRLWVLDLQDVISSLEQCRKPVLAAIHGACVGGGVDLVTAADMRYCTADARFIVKEIDLGLVADVGTLQRLPKVIGDGMAREMAYTGRPVGGPEAKEIGLVNRCFDSRAAMLDGVRALARQIAAKSPLAVRGTKEMIKYTRDHSVRDSLDMMAIWNAGLLVSEDLMEAFAAVRGKRPAKFRD